MSEMTKAKDMTTYDFREMEKRDEEQILQELRGQVVEEMIYQFPSGGRTITGISWVGIKEIARRYGKIDTQLIEFQDLGESVMFIVKAIDIEKGTGLLGTATQSKMMKRKDGTVEEDPFAVTKALSKAQRNAIRSIIPETFFKAVFAELSKGGRPPESKPSRGYVRKDVTVDPPPRKEVEADQSQPAGEQIPLKSLTPAGVMNYLAQNIPSLTREDLDIRDTGGAIEIYPKKHLDYWKTVCDLVDAVGGEWIDFEGEKDKDSHWWIPRQNDPEEPPQEAPPTEEPEPKEEEKPSQGTPRSIENVKERLEFLIPEYNDLVKVTEYEDYYRIGRKKILDKETENHLDFLVSEMGGEFNKDKNEWRIEKT